MIRGFLILILNIITLLLILASPFLLFMAASGSMLNETGDASDAMLFPIGWAIFLGIPWFLIGSFWYLLLRKKKSV